MSAMSVADPLLVETVDRLLADVCPSEEVEHAEATGWSQTAWDALAEAGFPWVGIAEAAGGSGGTLFDIAAIVQAVGRHAAPVPLAETGMLGGYCLTAAGLALPTGPLTVVESPAVVANSDGGGRVVLDGAAAWGRQAERIVAADHERVYSLRRDQVDVTPGANIAGEARDRIVADVSLNEVEWGPADVSHELRLRGALSRVLMAAGALSAVAQMTVDYTNERRQFGKPVATFQAVQQHLVVAAQSAVRAQMAADVAVRALADGSVDIEIAAARVVVDDAITLGTRAAHQAHGAMGVTREYPLHQLTRRLWSWRHEWGTTKQWRRALGQRVIAIGADELYPLITR
jgi:acyl-CoA dehydrogenase